MFGISETVRGMAPLPPRRLVYGTSPRPSVDGEGTGGGGEQVRKGAGEIAAGQPSYRLGRRAHPCHSTRPADGVTDAALAGVEGGAAGLDLDGCGGSPSPRPSDDEVDGLPRKGVQVELELRQVGTVLRDLTEEDAITAADGVSADCAVGGLRLSSAARLACQACLVGGPARARYAPEVEGPMARWLSRAGGG
jgi:hypothetical protein